MRYTIIAFLLVIITSCSFLSSQKKKGLDLGPPTKIFDIDISGDHLFDLINLPILSDSSKNLLRELGTYKYSTSRDQYNPYAAGDIRIYYEFEGITLEYIGENAGSVTNETLLESIKKFPKSFYLYSITIEPAKYKSLLPKQIQHTDGPYNIESKIGKHNEHFVSNSTTERVKYFYPHFGLEFTFAFYLNDQSSDSSIYSITITDSIKEMERFPTIYPKEMK